MNREDVRQALDAVKERIRSAGTQGPSAGTQGPSAGTQGPAAGSQGDAVGAFQDLCRVSDPGYDYAIQARFASLFRKLPLEALGLQPIRIGLLAGSTVDHYVEVLGWWLARQGFAADFYVSDYDTIHQTVLDPSSRLYEFRPDVVWLFTTHRDVQFPLTGRRPIETVEAEVNAAVGKWTSLWAAIAKNTPCYIIQNTADLPTQRVFGNYEAVAAWTRVSQLRRFNLRLAEAVGSGVALFDLDYVSSLYGKDRWFDARYWYHSKHAFSFDAYGLVAAEAAALIGAIKGRAKKCLVLDLDNTLWGGEIGDDGLDGLVLGSGPAGEAFLDFQEYLLEMKRRGVILAVCSKNDLETAKEPFERHPDMRLRLGDIAVFKANWDNKADNLRQIAETLNIGLDSLVFVDDNPAERALVRNILPEVAVPELPDDPALYVDALAAGRYFETVSFSDEDEARGEMYRANAARVESQKAFTDLSAYLEGLEMESVVGVFDEFHLPRIAQLINKSNQFHLTTTRYTEAQIKEMTADPACVCRYFKLKDCFGDNGLISAVILKEQDVCGDAEDVCGDAGDVCGDAGDVCGDAGDVCGDAGDDKTLFIDTWVMSCRVLSRTMEEFICGEMAALGQARGARRLVGMYIATKKNGLVSGLYERLGFRRLDDLPDSTLWELDLMPRAAAPHTYVRKTPA